jgi:hypothetical protein
MRIQIIILLIGLLIAIIIRSRPFFMNRPWLFRKQIQHEKFGRLWYIKDKTSPIGNYYQGHIYFAPVNKEIDIFFASDSEFDSKQESFYKKIENEYRDLYPECKRLLEDKFKTKLEDLYLDAILLATSSNLNRLWTLRFVSEGHNLLNIRVNFLDWKIQDIKN